MNVEFQKAMHAAREKLEAKMGGCMAELDRCHRQHGGSHRKTQSRLHRLAREIESLELRIERINRLIEIDLRK